MTGSEAAIWGDDAVLRKEHAKAENSEVADQDVVMVDSSINSAADVTTTKSKAVTAKEREKSVWITPKATIQGQAQARLSRAQRTIYIAKNQTWGYARSQM